MLSARGCVRPFQRAVGRAFDALYVNGTRYACYDQSRYLARHPTPQLRATGFDWTLYQVMVSDRARVDAYRRDIEATVRGKTVLEIGPGPTAVFTRIALQAGADLVITLEANAWAAEEARRRVRGMGERVEVLARHSDQLRPGDIDGRRHFDVLIVESYHAIASQEAVVETITTLRRNGFSFGEVISRGFTTYVAPAAAPVSGPMTPVELVSMGWPASRRRADREMAVRASSLHGDMGLIASWRLAPAQVWQQADLEGDGRLTTADSLDFEIGRAQDYAGLQFFNRFHFHAGDLDTGVTPTDWGVYYLPLPVARATGGSARFTLTTRSLEPASPSVVELRAELAGSPSARCRL